MFADNYWLFILEDIQSQFAIKVLRVIRLSPCQPERTFELSITIKVITMQIIWSSSWKVRDQVTKELCNHFAGEFCHDSVFCLLKIYYGGKLKFTPIFFTVYTI